jgi:HD superfamily phosphohydrolase
MKRAKEFKESLYRDPVHGIITLNRSRRHERTLAELLDAAEVQRLRRIRQLGLAYLVYQGAEHSRFTHVIGVMHLMGSILRRLSEFYPIDREMIFLGQCAGLLHDVGHGPFSHVFERFTQIDHEDWTREIIVSPHSEVHSVLSASSIDLPEKLVAILHERKHQPRVLTDLIASQLDADRFDYLARDSLMTGVKHGVFDLERLIHMLRIHPKTGRLVVAQKGIMPLEKYLHARYYMYRQVYQHKTVVAAEAMLTAMMNRVQQLLVNPDESPQPGSSHQGVQETIPGLEKLASSPLYDENLPTGLAGLGLPRIILKLLSGEKRISLSEYHQLDEAMMVYTMGELTRAPDQIVGDLAQRILTRKLFKTALFEEAPPPRRRVNAARRVLHQAGFNPDFYLLKIKSGGVGYAPFDPHAKHQKNIECETRDGKFTDVTNVSEAIRALTNLKYTTTQFCFPGYARNGVPLRQDILKALQTG